MVGKKKKQSLRQAARALLVTQGTVTKRTIIDLKEPYVHQKQNYTKTLSCSHRSV